MMGEFSSAPSDALVIESPLRMARPVSGRVAGGKGMEDEAWAVCGPFVVRVVVVWLFSWGSGPEAGRALCTALHGVELHCRSRVEPGDSWPVPI